MHAADRVEKLLVREVFHQKRGCAGLEGTNDLDIGLALAVMSDERYAEISARLRAEGFHPDKNDDGTPLSSGGDLETSKSRSTS